MVDMAAIPVIRSLGIYPTTADHSPCQPPGSRSLHTSLHSGCAWPPSIQMES